MSDIIIKSHRPQPFAGVSAQVDQTQVLSGLPDEMLLHILSFLPRNELASVRVVNKMWCQYGIELLAKDATNKFNYLLELLKKNTIQFEYDQSLIKFNVLNLSQLQQMLYNAIVALRTLLVDNGTLVMENLHKIIKEETERLLNNDFISLKNIKEIFNFLSSSSVGAHAFLKDAIARTLLDDQTIQNCNHCVDKGIDESTDNGTLQALVLAATEVVKLIVDGNPPPLPSLNYLQLTQYFARVLNKTGNNKSAFVFDTLYLFSTSITFPLGDLQNMFFALINLNCLPQAINNALTINGQMRTKILNHIIKALTIPDCYKLRGNISLRDYPSVGSEALQIEAIKIVDFIVEKDRASAYTPIILNMFRDNEIVKAFDLINYTFTLKAKPNLETVSYLGHALILMGRRDDIKSHLLPILTSNGKNKHRNEAYRIQIYDHVSNNEFDEALKALENISHKTLRQSYLQHIAKNVSAQIPNESTINKIYDAIRQYGMNKEASVTFYLNFDFLNEAQTSVLTVKDATEKSKLIQAIIQKLCDSHRFQEARNLSSYLGPRLKKNILEEIRNAASAAFPPSAILGKRKDKEPYQDQATN